MIRFVRGAARLLSEAAALRLGGRGLRRAAVLARAGRLSRYSLVSVVNILVGQTVLGVCFGLFGWSAPMANLAAIVIATVPSYLLNRAWVWGRSGRSRLLTEILPFWAMALAGLALSTLVATSAENLAGHVGHSRALHTALVMASVLGCFGLLWLARFVVLERLWASDPPTPRPAGLLPPGSSPREAADVAV